ncbi:MAG TPA: DUF1206 domain-containing protein, partial [Gemmatimonadales bacterium]|nr:DUF1206 domain-containing protein [Gemmatimonadales bacterium]
SHYVPPMPASRLVIDRVARIGFLGKGLVAVVIGAVALRMALGEPAGLVGPEGALQRFVGHPLGRGILGFLAISLWAHAAWKLIESFLDIEAKGHGLVATAERVSFFFAGLGYLLLGTVAARLTVGGVPSSGPDFNDLTAAILTPVLGRLTVGLVGAIVTVSGLLQVRLGLVAGFRHIFPLDRMSRPARVTVLSLGRAGYAALGVISGLIGWFLLRVAWYFDPDQAGGWRDALGFLAGVGQTRWTLGIVAAGLVCYGLFFILQLRYRDIGPTG